MSNVINLEEHRLFSDPETRGYVFGYLTSILSKEDIVSMIFNQLSKEDQNKIKMMAKSQGVM